MAKLKQYLENSWYRWASQDRQTWYAAQYQYGYGVNTRDMKNWVCLAWWATDSETQSDYRFIYFYNDGNLYTFNTNWEIADINWTIKCTVTPSWANRIIFAETFWNYVYVTIWNKIYKVDPSLWTSTDATPWAFAWVTWWLLNYANTFLLCWSYDEVWRFDWLTWTKIRDFESWYQVVWLTQEWNYLKIYTSDDVNTKVHYAKGTFDVEDTWLVQTVSFKWLWLSAWDITYDQWNDYVIFEIESWEYKLAKIQWYNKVDIRWTQTWWWQKIFTADDPVITAADWVVFAAMEDGIWTFTEYNWWLWWWCCEFPIASNEEVKWMFRFWEKLYACIHNKTTDKYINRYHDMCFHPHKYQPNWYIIGRVFDWWCAWLFKKNDQATITYNMPVWTSMELSYRYDRDTFTYDKSNFLSIKKLTDVNSCYDIVVPTTPWQRDIDLLALESDDSNTILLENGNNIMLEDLMICPFNKTWNLLEYRFDFTGNWDPANNIPTTKTPILFEHSLTYYDYMRKYR